MKPDAPDHPRSPAEARKLAAAYSCPECGASPAVGKTVKVSHDPSCEYGAVVRKMAQRGTQAA
jgi:hypothetical protein